MGEEVRSSNFRGGMQEGRSRDWGNFSGGSELVIAQAESSASRSSIEMG